MYDLSLRSTTGVQASTNAHVQAGTATRINFFQPANTSEIFVFRPAIAVAATDPQPDVNADGTVNSADLAVVRACLGLATTQCGNPFVDVNGDGAVNQLDVDLVLASFRTQRSAGAGIVRLGHHAGLRSGGLGRFFPCDHKGIRVD